jgi:ATP-dependent Clp protease adaptor protein ClpS
VIDSEMTLIINSDEKISVNPATNESVKIDPPWQVIVMNDPVNLMNYVVLVFRRVFGYDLSHAKQIMLEVHDSGKAVAWEGNREMAEHYVCTLQQWQITAHLNQEKNV